MRHTVAAGAALFLAGCFCGDSSSGQGGGGGGGSSKSTITYDLVEVMGEFKLSGSTTSGSCTSVTTDARTLLSLEKPDTKSATFDLKEGELSGYVSVIFTRPPRAGTTTCASGGAKACPGSPDDPYTGEASIKVVTEPAVLGKDAAPGLAFIPVLENVQLRELCQNVTFAMNPAWLRGKPVTVAQLRSGRFVVEASGTTPLLAPVPELGKSAPTPVTGTMAYSFRLVFQTADYDAKNAVAAPDLPSFDQCLVDVDPTPADQLASETAFAAGATDIAMNANGCRRLKVTRDGGSESMVYERTFGTRLVFDAASGTTRAEPDTRILYTHTIDGAGIRETFDMDQNGTIDRRVETTFDGGVWAATVATDTGATLSQVRLDATTMTVRTESGGIVLDEYVAPIVQRSCFDANSMQAPDCRSSAPPPTCNSTVPAPCGASTTTALKNELLAAMIRGANCLKNTGMSFDPTAKLAASMTANKLKFLCTDNPCDDYGSLATGPRGNGSYDLTFNTARNVTAAERARTLFHESMHSGQGFSHNDTLNKAASNACKLQITDRTFACETMCFNPQAANKCVCMRCLSDGSFYKTDDATCKKCNAFGSCAGRTESGKPIASAVGAWCGRGKLFCDTKVECDTSCAAYGGGCQPLKATCDAGCN